MGICLDGASSLELLRAERFRHAEPDYRVSEREVRLPPKWDILPDRTVPADSFPNAELLQRCIEGPLRELRQPIGLLVGSDGMRSKPSPQSRCSVCSLELPPGSFVRVADGLFACTPELAFAHLSAHAGFTETLRVGFELCGSYAIAPRAPGGLCRSAPPTQARRIREYMDALAGEIARKLGVRIRRRDRDERWRTRQEALRAELDLPTDRD